MNLATLTSISSDLVTLSHCCSFMFNILKKLSQRSSSQLFERAVKRFYSSFYTVESRLFYTVGSRVFKARGEVVKC